MHLEYRAEISCKGFNDLRFARLARSGLERGIGAGGNTMDLVSTTLAAGLAWMAMRGREVAWRGPWEGANNSEDAPNV